MAYDINKILSEYGENDFGFTARNLCRAFRGVPIAPSLHLSQNVLTQLSKTHRAGASVSDRKNRSARPETADAASRPAVDPPG